MTRPTATKDSSATQWSTIPSTGQVYNYAREIWEPNEAIVSPTMLGYAGRTISVTRCSRNAASAFKLLEWLACGEITNGLSQRSVPAADLITRQLSQENCFMLPRIPAIDDYLEALAEAVTDEKAAPKQALQSASEQWEKITTEQGRDRQRAAYRKHLGYE